MTDFLRDKINLLEQQIQQDEQQKFAHELIVADAAVSTGDKEIDKQFAQQAANAKAVVKACEHRLKLRRAKLAELQKELEAQNAEVRL